MSGSDEWIQKALELSAENAALKASPPQWVKDLAAERDEFQALNEHHKEQFLRVNLELTQAKKERDALNKVCKHHEQIENDLLSQLEQAQQREARLRDTLDRIFHVCDGKPALQLIANEARNAINETRKETA
jgi:uncharacterized protein YdaT